MDYSLYWELYQRLFDDQNIYCYDEKNELNVGDSVIAIECRPLSKTKSFRLKTILATGVK